MKKLIITIAALVPKVHLGNAIFHLIIAITLLAASANAQLYKGFGVKIGTTIANQHITYPTNILTVGNEYYDPNKDMKYKAGLTFGLFKEIDIVENLKTQIGINYARKGYISKGTTEIYPEGVNITTNIDFITSEIYAKYDILKKDIKPYLLAGLRLDFFLSLKKYYDDGTEIIYKSLSDNNDIILGASFGAGVEFKTSKLTNIFIEAALNPDITYLREYDYDYKYRGHSFDIRTGIKF